MSFKITNMFSEFVFPLYLKVGESISVKGKRATVKIYTGPGINCNFCILKSDDDGLCDHLLCTAEKRIDGNMVSFVPDTGGQMDVEVLRKKRRTLQANITTAVATMVDAFRMDTGLSPSSISINMRGVVNFGSKEPLYLVEGVEVRLEI